MHQLSDAAEVPSTEGHQPQPPTPDHEIALTALPSKGRPEGTGRPLYHRYHQLAQEAIHLRKKGTPGEKQRAQEHIDLLKEAEPFLLELFEWEWLRDLDLRYGDRQFYGLHWAWDSWWALPLSDKVSWISCTVALSALLIYHLVREIKVHRPKRAERDEHMYWINHKTGLFEKAATEAQIELRLLYFGITSGTVLIAAGIFFANAWYEDTFPFTGNWQITASIFCLIPLFVICWWLVTVFEPQDWRRYRTIHPDRVNLTGMRPTNFSDTEEVRRRSERQRARQVRWAEARERLVRRGQNVTCYDSGNGTIVEYWNATATGAQYTQTACINSTAGQTSGAAVGPGASCDEECQNGTIIPNSEVSCWSPAALCIVLIVVFAVTSIVLGFCLCKRFNKAAGHSGPTVPAANQEKAASAPNVPKFLGDLVDLVDGMGALRDRLDALGGGGRGGGPVGNNGGNNNIVQGGPGPTTNQQLQNPTPVNDLEVYKAHNRALEEEYQRTVQNLDTKALAAAHLLETSGAFMALHWLTHHYHDHCVATVSQEVPGGSAYRRFSERLKLECLGPGFAIMLHIYCAFHIEMWHLHMNYYSLHRQLAGALHGATPAEQWQHIAHEALSGSQWPPIDGAQQRRLEEEWGDHIAIFQGIRPQVLYPSSRGPVLRTTEPVLRVNPTQQPFVYLPHDRRHGPQGSWQHGSVLIYEHVAYPSDPHSTLPSLLRGGGGADAELLQSDIIQTIFEWIDSRQPIAQTAAIFGLFPEVQRSGDIDAGGQYANIMKAFVLDPNHPESQEKKAIMVRLGVKKALDHCRGHVAPTFGASYNVQPSICHTGDAVALDGELGAQGIIVHADGRPLAFPPVYNILERSKFPGGRKADNADPNNPHGDNVPRHRRNRIRPPPLFPAAGPGAAVVAWDHRGTGGPDNRMPQQLFEHFFNLRWRDVSGAFSRRLYGLRESQMWLSGASNLANWFFQAPTQRLAPVWPAAYNWDPPIRPGAQDWHYWNPTSPLRATDDDTNPFFKPISQQEVNAALQGYIGAIWTDLVMREYQRTALPMLSQDESD